MDLGGFLRGIGSFFGGGSRSNGVLYVYKTNDGGVYRATRDGSKDLVTRGGTGRKEFGGLLYHLEPPGVKRIANLGAAPTDVQKAIRGRYRDAIGLRKNGELDVIRGGMEDAVPRQAPVVVEKPKGVESGGGYTPTPQKKK